MTAEVVPMKLEQRSLPWESWKTAITATSYNGTCMVYTRFYRYNVSCLQYTNRSVSKCIFVFGWPVNSLLFRLLEVGIYQGITRNFWKCFCTPVLQLEHLWVLYARAKIGDSVSSVRPCHNTWNFCEFCATFIPVPGTSISSVPPSHKIRGTGTPLVHLPRTSASSIRPCHNTRYFC